MSLGSEIESESPRRVALILHGNSGSSDQMLHFVKELEEKGYLVLNYDLRLHGRDRSFIQALMIDNCAEFFLGVLSQYNKDHITLVGYSDGANIILKLIQLRLSNVSQVFLILPNSSASEIQTPWRVVFVISQFLLLLVIYVPQFRVIYRRIGMMTRYKANLNDLLVPGRTTVVYAERDLILKRDQEYVSGKLRQKAYIVPGVNHFTVLNSEELMRIFNERIA